MTKNVGRADRVLRAFGALAMLGGAALAPWPLTLRLALFVPMAGYLLFTALAGTCLGYKLMGRSTCAIR